jgi:hypothetical protein
MWSVARKKGVFMASALVVIALTMAWSPACWGMDMDIGVSLEPLADQELDQMRGGYSGIFFGVQFSGFWDSLGALSGSMVHDGNGQSGPPPTLPSGLTITGNGSSSQPTSGAAIQAYVGNFQGASGIFQISQVPGSNNIVQNNLTVQITLIHVANQIAVSDLMSQLF